MFKWNEQQEVAIKGIVDFIESPYNHDDPQWAMTIIGFAGTGKTTLVQEAIKQVTDHEPNLQVAVSAPTNKATSVLMNFGKDAGVIVETRTIYSLLGLVLGDSGEVKTVFQGGEGEFGNYQVVIIDEASMVGNMLMDTLYDRAIKYGVRVIFMGDNAQLNPVREGKSRCFSTLEVPLQYKLTQVMRQDEGSPIRETIAHLRDLADKKIVPPKFETSLTASGDGVHIAIGKEFEELMLAQFECDEYKNDPTFVRALAWTNKEVDRLNALIRHRIYGDNCEDFVVGETITVLTPVMDMDNRPVIFTDDECEILSIGVGSITDTSDHETLKEGNPKYKVWVLEVKLSTGGAYKIYALHRDSEKAYKKRCDYLAKMAKARSKPWKTFWAFHDMFTRVRPVHAMTIHKSQGQTFETVFFNSRDAGNNPNTGERARLYYVAGSRAKTNLVINRARLS